MSARVAMSLKFPPELLARVKAAFPALSQSEAIYAACERGLGGAPSVPAVRPPPAPRLPSERLSQPQSVRLRDAEKAHAYPASTATKAARDLPLGDTRGPYQKGQGKAKGAPKV